MNSRWDELWPTPEPPDDFALQIVVKSVEARSTPRTGWRWALAAIVPSLCVMLAMGLAFHQHQEESAKRAGVLEAQRKDTEDRLRRLQADFDAASRREQELQASLANAKDEATRTKLQAELDQQRSKTQAAGRAVKPSGAWFPAAKAGGAPKKKASNCTPGDPFCD